MFYLTRKGAASFVLGCVVLLTALVKLSPAQRLPGTVLPENYKLFLDPDLKGGKFDGEETIRLQVTQPVQEVVLNSLDLDITVAELTAGGNTQPARISYDKPNEMVRLAVTGVVPAGPASLHLKFSGPLTDGLRGLYLSRSSRRAYAVTQFEGTYARMMFPSFDEPAFKATFDLSVIVAKGDTAISNGRIIADEPVPGGRHKLIFTTSPRMSTYLVALAVGDWQCLKGNADSVPIRVCTVPEKKAMGKFALETAEHSIKFYDRWYGIPYPFGKLDMVAIPDYEWGGMENTAAIFYRETALLLGDKTASVFARRDHATVIAHEIAHQWFGDLVTAAWWDDIWLNEGFASWMERKPIEAWHPEWRLEEDEAASTQQIIAVDSLATARAIHGDPHTSAEIKEMFDGITYEKGAAVIGMLESYVGPEVFRNGVNKYLQAHANGNATAADFWRAETEVSGKPVDRIMPPFVMQPGVPLISISGACHADSMPLKIAQERFLLSPLASPESSDPQWMIPVCFKMETGAGASCRLITRKTEEMSLSKCPGWFFANRDAKGYYRVFYENSLSQVMIAGVAGKELDPSERMALVEDAWAMTRAKKNPANMFLELAKDMRGEHNRNVLDFLAAHLSSIGRFLVSEEYEAKYRAFLLAQFRPLAQELGWNTRAADSDEQKALRASLLEILGGAGDPEAIAAAREIVKRYMHSPGSVEGTIARPAFLVAAANGDAAFYEQMSAVVANPRSVDDYYYALLSLAQFRQASLVQRTLALVDQNKIHQQDYPALFSALLENPASRDDTWNYLKAHWDALAEKVTTFGGRGAVSALGGFCSPALRDDVRTFFADHRAPGAEGALKQSLERMDNCIEFKQLQQSSVRTWLEEQN